jgi:hypothetical protein
MKLIGNKELVQQCFNFGRARHSDFFYSSIDSCLVFSSTTNVPARLLTIYLEKRTHQSLKLHNINLDCYRKLRAVKFPPESLLPVFAK